MHVLVVDVDWQGSKLYKSPKLQSASSQPVFQEAQDLNHIAVFLTGAAPFPDGYACSIHLELPGQGWSVIGSLSNSKPSAIFRLRGTLIPSTASQASGFTSAFSTSVSAPIANPHLLATLGILCEPISSVEAQLAAVNQSGSKPVDVGGGNTIGARTTDPVLIAQKVGMNLFNTIGGFAQPLPDGSGSWVEMGVIEKWYRNFERKLKTGSTSFLFGD